MNEFARIDRFLRVFRDAGGATSSDRVLLGPGDDAAIVSTKHPLAVTTDALVEHVHFRRAWATPEQIGHKALAANLSDLAAMGARPTAFTCALALPPSVDDVFLDGLAHGLARLARDNAIVLCGGNFTRAGDISITITALGEIEGEALRRDRAKSGDVVMLVGPVGVAAAELRVLLSGASLPAGPSALHEPHAFVREGLLAAKLLRCGIDISDGLVQDAGHVARASGVRIHLDFKHIPRTPRFDLLTHDLDEARRATLLVAGGEDYALVLCGPESAAMALGATIVGRVEEGGGVSVDHLPAGALVEGHDHFR